MNKAFFIDKDGTLVDNSMYPDSLPKDDILENDVIGGLKAIKNKGYKIFIISNQPWIAKGLMTKKEVEKVFYSIVSQFKEIGVVIDGYYYCPHQSSDNCDCKKPKPGLILRAAKENNIDISKSYMVGDMENDVLAGRAAGVKTILVRTGNGKDFVSVIGDRVDIILNNVNEISKII